MPNNKKNQISQNSSIKKGMKSSFELEFYLNPKTIYI